MLPRSHAEHGNEWSVPALLKPPSLGSSETVERLMQVTPIMVVLVNTLLMACLVASHKCFVLVNYQTEIKPATSKQKQTFAS